MYSLKTVPKKIIDEKSMMHFRVMIHNFLLLSMLHVLYELAYNIIYIVLIKIKLPLIF